MKEGQVSYTVSVQVTMTLDVIKRDGAYGIVDVGHCYPPETSDVIEAIVNNEDELAAFNAACAKVLGPLDIEGGEEE